MTRVIFTVMLFCSMIFAQDKNQQKEQPDPKLQKSQNFDEINKKQKEQRASKEDLKEVGKREEKTLKPASSATFQRQRKQK